MGVAIVSTSSSGANFIPALRESVEGRTSSKLKCLGVAEASGVRNARRAELSLKSSEDNRSRSQLANPVLRSATRASSTHADGMNVVTRKRLGGSVNGSWSESWSCTNYGFAIVNQRTPRISTLLTSE